MANVVTTISSVVRLATAATQMTKTIRDVIDSVKNAPKRLTLFSVELDNLAAI